MISPGEQGRVTVSRQGKTIIVNNHDAGNLCLGLTWRCADDFARTIRSIVDKHIDIGPHTIDTHIKIRGEVDGDPYIIAEYDGRIILLARYAAAVFIANLVTRKAREIEEEELAEEIAAEEALNFRGAWLPFGLSSNPEIRKQAEREAAYGAEPRKYIPMSRIDNKFHPFPPSIKQLDPNASITERLANLTPEERQALKEALDAH